MFGTGVACDVEANAWRVVGWCGMVCETFCWSFTWEASTLA